MTVIPASSRLRWLRCCWACIMARRVASDF
jgi:hypothetical protein